MSLNVAPVLFPMLVEFTMIAGAILVKMYLHSFSKHKHAHPEEHDVGLLEAGLGQAQAAPSVPAPAAHHYEKHSDHHENRSSALYDAAPGHDGGGNKADSSPPADSDNGAAASPPARKCYSQIHPPASPPAAENVRYWKVITLLSL